MNTGSLHLVAGMLGALAAHPVVGQFDVLDSLLARNKHVITFRDNGLCGDTAFLLNACGNAQFVLIGENHNTKEIPEFTAALFALLNAKYGYEHLALEQDPIMMRLLATRSRSIEALARTYPSGFTFITDEELRMIDQARSISSAKDPIWGCDQSFGASHALAEMSRSLRSENVVIPDLDSLRSLVQANERTRRLGTYHYMSELGKRSELRAASEAVPIRYRSALAFYTDQLLMSDSIYTLIRNGSYYEGRRIREQYMKLRFLEEYRAAKANSRAPKVLLKFGNYHLYDGYNPGSNVGSLGSFVRQLAMMNGGTTIAINALIHRNDGSDWDHFNDDPAWVFLQRFADHASVQQWTLFDLRPIRQVYSDKGLTHAVTAAERNNLEDLIYGYDLLLLIGNGTDGHASSTRGEY